MDEAKTVCEHGEPWFEDGNLILLAYPANIAFKVHRGMLARHSEIFQSMFQLPPPSQADVEEVDGCPLVRMYDLPTDLGNLIKALYDGAIFQNRNVSDFCDVAGILRLSSKYLIAHLRIQAIRFLAQTWSHTLRGHDEMVELAMQSPVVEGMSYPYAHPLHVLNLARETNVGILVPSAMYFLSLYPLKDIIRADHPKLQIDHPSRPSSQLSLEDMQCYTLVFQHRIEVLADFVRRICGQRAASTHCTNDASICVKAFSKLATTLSRAWMLRTGPLHFMVQAMDELAIDVTVCRPCRRAFREDVYTARKKFWNDLPGLIGLPSWEILYAEDLGTKENL